mmetsp:Transcript_104274/g.264806  ORF Transcript_104274/g.264806 Transcript_104274/m.264806 type:complete len:225 (+) Transcript_104274:118-792(+)
MPSFAGLPLCRVQHRHGVGVLDRLGVRPLAQAHPPCRTPHGQQRSPIFRVLGECEPYAHLRVVVNGVILPEEGVAEDEQRALGRRDVQGHEAQGADPIVLSDIILRGQLQGQAGDDETHRGQLAQVRAILGDLQLLDHHLHNLGWAGKQGGACVDSDLALALSGAQAQAILAQKHILHLYLPIARRRDRSPVEFAAQALLPVLAEENLALLTLIAKEDAEQGLL